MLRRFLILLTLACVVSPAWAFKFETALTQSRLTQQPDGIWCQSGVSKCDVKLRVTGAYLGGIWDLENADRLHVGVWYVGHSSSDGMAVPDAAYDSAAQACVGGKCPYASRFKTHWNTWGVRAMYDRQWRGFNLYGGATSTA